MVLVAMEVAQGLVLWVERIRRRARKRVRGRKEIAGRLPKIGLVEKSSSLLVSFYFLIYLLMSVVMVFVGGG